MRFTSPNPAKALHCLISAIAVSAIALAEMTTLSPQASAAVTFYTNLSSFQAATTGLTDVNFNGIVASQSFANYATPPGLTLSGVNFNIVNGTINDALNVTARNFYSPGVTYANDFLVAAFNPNRTTLSEIITLPSAVTALGLSLGTFNGGTLTYNFSNGDTYTQTSPVTFGNTSFLGFTTSSAITSLNISLSVTGGESLVIDDVKFGTAVVAAPGVAPEPGSLALLLPVMGTVGIVVRRRHSQK